MDIILKILDFTVNIIYAIEAGVSVRGVRV